MARKQNEQQRTIIPYVSSDCKGVFDKVQEIRHRRGYSKDLMIWEILVDLDAKLTALEADAENAGVSPKTEMPF